MLPCMCSSLRRASRAFTQLYDRAFRPLGLRATQFTVLQVLSRVGEVSQGRLGQMLAMDSTTLTRTLELMARRGWIADRRGQDRRQRWLYLTEAGKRQLRRAEPPWEKVQMRLRRQFGEQRWRSLMQLSHEAADRITARGDWI